MIGAAALKEAVAAAGLKLLEGEAGRDADVVVVSGHREFDYDELLTATLRPQGGATLFATSRDPTLPMPGGAWPGPARSWPRSRPLPAQRAEIGGKPERHLFDLARALLRDRRAGWRWSATGSPPTSRAAAAPAWRRSSSSAEPRPARRRSGPSRRRTTSIDDLAGLLR